MATARLRGCVGLLRRAGGAWRAAEDPLVASGALFSGKEPLFFGAARGALSGAGPAGILGGARLAPCSAFGASAASGAAVPTLASATLVPKRSLRYYSGPAQGGQRPGEGRGGEAGANVDASVGAKHAGGKGSEEGEGRPAPGAASASEAEFSTNAETGWSYEKACTVPNLVSLARAVSSPFLGYCIVSEQYALALGGTLVAGVSDWLDGFLAKRMKNQESSLGSYLDPLADKVLVTCLTVASGYKGLIDPTVCAVIIGRDVLLLGGAFVHRAAVLNWRWRSWNEYFRVTDSGSSSGDNGAKGKGESGKAPAAPLVKPIFISKLNTVFQIALVSSAITQGAMAWPSAELVQGLGYLTATTTIASGLIYVRMYFKGQMLT